MSEATFPRNFSGIASHRMPDRNDAKYPERSQRSTRTAMSTQYWSRSLEKSHLTGAGGSLRYLTVDGAWTNVRSSAARMKCPLGERGMLQDLPGYGESSFFFQAPPTHTHTRTGVSREVYERRKKRDVSKYSARYP